MKISDIQRRKAPPCVFNKAMPALRLSLRGVREVNKLSHVPSVCYGVSANAILWQAVIDVNLPRPRGDRTRALPEFQALAQHIWQLIRDEAYRATVT